MNGKSMEQSKREQTPFQVGDWLVQPRESRLLSANAGRLVQRNVIAILSELAATPGQEVSRDQLRQALNLESADGDIVLNRAVASLHQVFDGYSPESAYIEETETGYRLLAPVRRLSTIEAPARGILPRKIVSMRSWAFLSLVLGFSAAILWAIVLLISPDAESTASWNYGEAKFISTKPGQQLYPALSPDGTRLAFTWRVKGRKNWDIYVQTIGENDILRVTDGEMEETYAAWSGDGEYLAYIREGLYGPAIYKRPVRGGSKVLLAACPPGTKYLNWSPDDRFLTYSAREATDPGPSRIWVLRVENRKLKPLSGPPMESLGDVEPRFSPNGRQVAFRRKLSSFQEDLYVVPSTGGRVRKITEGNWGLIAGFDWSADGKALICSANRDGRTSLWRIPLQGGTPERLPYQSDWPIWPRTARENDRLVYKSYTGSYDLNVFSLDGEQTSPMAITSTTESNPNELSQASFLSNGIERFPQLSPDGKRLAFLSDRSGHYELWTTNLDGSNPRQHTWFEGAPPGPPSWSPDGLSLFFDAHPREHADIYRVYLHENRVERLTHDPADERYPRLSRDGRYLYYGSNRSGTWQIWRQSLNAVSRMDSSSAVQMTTDGGLMAQEADDGALYFVKPGESSLWRQPTGGGAAVAVLELDNWEWGSWVVRSSGVYTLQREPLRLVHINEKTGASRTVHQLASADPSPDPSFTVSADETLLVFGQAANPEDAVIAADLNSGEVVTQR